jgi:hypothetical protein
MSKYLDLLAWYVYTWCKLILLHTAFKKKNGRRLQKEGDAQALVSFKQYMPHPLPYFKVNIYPYPLPHFASIFFVYL